MEKMMKIEFCPKVTSITLFAIFMISCSGGSNPDLDQVKSHENLTVIAGTRFEEIYEKAFSRGILVAREIFPDSRSAAYFQFLSEIQPGGFLMLSAFGEKILSGSANEPVLKNSIVLRFSRSNDGSRLLVHVTASGTTEDWSQFFKSVDAAKALQLGIDVHNNESGEAHILIWNLMQGSEKLIFDSALDIDGSPGKGFGRHWGLTADKAELMSARTSSPRYQH
jgi:hypothetical protein